MYGKRVSLFVTIFFSALLGFILAFALTDKTVQPVWYILAALACTVPIVVEGNRVLKNE